MVLDGGIMRSPDEGSPKLPRGSKRPIRLMRGAFWLGALIGVAVSCAKARVQNVTTEPAVLPRPGRVVVFDFETGGSDVRVGSSPARTAKRAVGLSVGDADLLAEAVADALASRLVGDVGALGLVAERAIGTSPPAPNDVVIQGQFIRIDEGSQVKRFVIGFGAGATELRTLVEMFQVSADGWRPITQFDTVAQGSRLPGAAFGVAGGAAVGAAATTSAIVGSGTGAIRELRASIDGDARRTSEQIAKKVSELKTAQRW
jgi:hypothetical protein